jgi:N-acetylglutamate synthase-like GNAT family acetyltransferase
MYNANKAVRKGQAVEKNRTPSLQAPIHHLTAGHSEIKLRLRIVMQPNIHIRKAVAEDIPALRALIDASVRGLQVEDYTPEQIEGALKTVFGVDSQLIADRTYFVAEAALESKLENAKVVAVGCGGWSKRKTLFGGDQWVARQDSLLDPRVDAAKIRSFFVHPAWPRRGIGSAILETCEAAAKAAGFSRAEMGATLTGVKLFQVRGYVPLESMEIPLRNGASLPVVRMAKQL